MSHSNPRVGVLGGGQLGRMLVLSANQHSIPITILDSPNAPAKQVATHNDHVDGSFADLASVRALADHCDVITAEIEHVDTYALEELEKSTEAKVRIEPDWRSIRIIQDKYTQKEHLAKAGIAQAEYTLVQKQGGEEGAETELESVGERFGYPFMLKSRTLAYDGRGNYTVQSKDDIPDALEALKGRPLYAEKWADYRMELAVMVVKTSSGVYSYPTVETVQENSICRLVYAPARNVSTAINKAAQKLARDAIASFDGKGVFGVEMFLMADGKSLLVCEVASRVHNSGHYTIEACELSQFDAHLRAILDLPIAPECLEMQVPAAIMLNVLGGKGPTNHRRLEALALSIPGAR
ncbi:phosphoribosylaminoimidazole carboxylase ade2, partial [Ascosphaera aggregata]